jgi:starvation-inducible outer membrane lipoprotein
MVKALLVTFLLALAGCSGLPQSPQAPSPCAGDEASYACQLERYSNVAAP